MKHFIKLERKTEIYEDRIVIPQKKECLKNQVSHARQTEIQIERLLKTERKIEFELQSVSGKMGRLVPSHTGRARHTFSV